MEGVAHEIKSSGLDSKDHFMLHLPQTGYTLMRLNQLFLLSDCSSRSQSFGLFVSNAFLSADDFSPTNWRPDGIWAGRDCRPALYPMIEFSTSSAVSDIPDLRVRSRCQWLQLIIAEGRSGLASQRISENGSKISKSRTNNSLLNHPMCFVPGPQGDVTYQRPEIRPGIISCALRNENTCRLVRHSATDRGISMVISDSYLDCFLGLTLISGKIVQAPRCKHCLSRQAPSSEILSPSSCETLAQRVEKLVSTCQS
jgi:hypothetical protein